MEKEILQSIKAKALKGDVTEREEQLETKQKQTPVIRIDEYDKPSIGLIEKKVSTGRSKGLNI